MDDLKSVTVEYLRDLARKHLGKGHSKLRSKAQLVAALAVAVPALAALAKKAKKVKKAKPVVDGRKPAVTDEKKAADKIPSKGAKAGTRKAGPTVKPAEVVNFPPKDRKTHV